jgi:hypothetical protein
MDNNPLARFNIAFKNRDNVTTIDQRNSILRRGLDFFLNVGTIPMSVVLAVGLVKTAIMPKAAYQCRGKRLRVEAPWKCVHSLGNRLDYKGIKGRILSKVEREKHIILKSDGNYFHRTSMVESIMIANPPLNLVKYAINVSTLIRE